jgi:methyl-accepting chemotaxis protein
MDRYALVKEMATIEDYTTLAMNVSSLVHELQKERGLSAVYIGSKGAKMGSELDAQRKNADKELGDLNKNFETFHGKELDKSINASKEILGKLDDSRKAVSGQAMTVPECVEYYSKLNNQLIGIIGSIPLLINNGEISNRFMGFLAAQNFKEPMGLERAILAGTFANNKFAPGMYRKLLEAVNTQDANRRFYSTIMFDDEDNMKPFDDFLKNDIVKKTVEFRELALSKSEVGNFGVDANEWVKLQTEKINLFNEMVISGNLSKDILSVTAEKTKKARASLIETAAGTSTILILMAFISIYLTSVILRNVRETTRVVGEIAQGDFTQEVRVEGLDEIGRLGIAVNGMVSDLRTMFRDMTQSSMTLASSAEELSSVSSTLARSSNEMAFQTTGVASATEQMSGNITSMASGIEETSMNATSVSSTAEEMSVNMRTIASAIEDMSSSISEVAKNSEDTAKVANRAMDLSRTATDTMKELGKAANEIGKVTEMIKRIAEQTNLLALNATIEAASAGDAGKGFAVVANEIKELANQSARAAEDIATKIGGIQGSTGNAVQVITDVSDIIGRINGSVNVITQAVLRQTATANEVSKNIVEVTAGANNIASSIAEVAKGTEDMSRSAGEAARGASEVSSNIGGITKVMADNNSGIQQINTSSSELAKIAGALQVMVAKFKVESTGDFRKEISLRKPS